MAHTKPDVGLFFSSSSSSFFEPFFQVMEDWEGHHLATPFPPLSAFYRVSLGGEAISTTKPRMRSHLPLPPFFFLFSSSLFLFFVFFLLFTIQLGSRLNLLLAVLDGVVSSGFNVARAKAAFYRVLPSFFFFSAVAVVVALSSG